MGLRPPARWVPCPYQVEHPRWRVYPLAWWRLDVNFAALYGPPWGRLRDREPVSVLYAKLRGHRAALRSIAAARAARFRLVQNQETYSGLANPGPLREEGRDWGGALAVFHAPPQNPRPGGALGDITDDILRPAKQ